MGVAFVGTTQNSATSGGNLSSLVLTYTPTVGNMVVIGVTFGNSIDAVGIACADNNGRSLTLSFVVAAIGNSSSTPSTPPVADIGNLREYSLFVYGPPYLYCALVNNTTVSPGGAITDAVTIPSSIFSAVALELNPQTFGSLMQFGLGF
jgi:hypothetical protein